jgi:hypothetical protein
MSNFSILISYIFLEFEFELGIILTKEMVFTQNPFT